MISLIRSPHLTALPFVNHGFTTRQGGVSKGYFSSLNAAMEKEDSHENVVENRRRIALAFQAEPKNLLTLSQVHSNTVIVVDAPWKHDKRPTGDALITCVPGLLMSVVTADCVPILLADPSSQMVAAIHAGWKGATSGIIHNTIGEMVRLGAKRQTIHAAIGPCIWQESYEVDASFYASFPLTDPNLKKRYFKESSDPERKGFWYFDLPGFVEGCLAAEEITSISASPANTYLDEERFFSYRRKTHRNEPVFGCGLSGIMIRTS